MTFGGASPQYLQSVADEIITLHPTVIVMQIDMIVGRWLAPEEFVSREQTERGSLSWRLQYWSGVLQQRLLKYLPQDREPPKKRRQLLNPLVSATPAGIRFLKKKRTENQRQNFYLHTAKNMWEGQTLSTTDPGYEICRQFIRKGVDEGIKVIVVQPPVSTTVESLVPKSYFE